MAFVFQRKNSKYLWIGYHEDGRFKRFSTKTSDKKVANYEKNKLEQRLAEGKTPPGLKNITIIGALNEYIEESKLKKSPQTIRCDNQRLRGFVSFSRLSYLKDIKLSSVEDYIHYRLKVKDKKNNSISPVTVNDDLVAIKTFLNWAIKKNYLGQNPAQKIKKVNVPEKIPRFLTTGEIDKLLATCKTEDKELYPLLAIAVFTGMRKNEMLNLKWQDIDFEKNVIRVENNPQFTTKSKRNRVIPLSHRLREILLPVRDNGTCFKLINLRRRFKKVCELAKVDIGWHSLRHTFGSRLAQEGVSIYKIAKWLGHSDLKTTQIYAHLSPQADEDINRI